MSRTLAKQSERLKLPLLKEAEHVEQKSTQAQLAGPERRQCLREHLKFQVSLQGGNGDVCGATENISLGGLQVICQNDLQLGAPLALEFSFGETCYLHLSGQVTYCKARESQGLPTYAVGIKFSTIRPLEAQILSSAIEELKRNVVAQEHALVRILVAEDSLAVEAGSLLFKTEQTILDRLDRLASEAHATAHTRYDETSSLIGLPTFKLLVDGEDLDTYKYRYFPYAEKLITDYKTVAQMLKQLKMGHSAGNHQEYIFARYCIGGAETNLRAMEAAHRASEEFRYFPVNKRLKILTDTYELLLIHKEKLIELMMIEGHPLRLAEWEYLGMERGLRKETLEFYKTQITRRIAVEGDEVLYWNRKPDGVICVSPPKNAPSSSSFIAVLALLGGNTLIIKPPLRSPISTLFLWKNIVHEALKMNDAPRGTLNIVIGNSEGIVDEWIASPHVNDILFIGDSKIGLEIGKRAYANGKKPILELSGNDMMFVWKDASIDEAVQSLLDGFLGSMQVCMVPKKAFIHEEIFNEFQAAFVGEVKKLKIGLPSDPEVSLSPVIKIGEFYEFLDDALYLGAELLCGGVRVDHLGIPDEVGRFIRPTVLKIEDSATANPMRCIKEENFFPLMPLVKVTANVDGHPDFRDKVIFEKMLDVASNNKYGLRISAWVTSPFYIQKFMDQMHNCGLLRINCRHVGFSSYLASHGGTGRSGGPYGELNYVWQKTTHLQGVSLRRMEVDKRDD
jgi:acyl-CoA reductase-like NAD-dependent aldehyde dehydrogenase